MYTNSQKEALICWLGTGYQSIANYYDSKASDQGNPEIAKVWRSAIEVSPIYKGTVYRGMCANEYQHCDFLYIKNIFTLKKGEEYYLTRPCSSTVSNSDGKEWAIPNETNKDFDHLSVLLILTVKSGRDIRGGPKHKTKDENEIVLLHGLRFIVSQVEDEFKITHNGNGNIKQKKVWLNEI